MKMTSKQMAQLLGMTPRGFVKLVHSLRIPHQMNKNKFIFDLNSPKFPDFFYSIKKALANPHLRAVYSLRNLSDLYQKDKKTIRTMLIENDVKLYYNGRKVMVLLADLERFRELAWKNREL